MGEIVLPNVDRFAAKAMNAWIAKNRAPLVQSVRSVTPVDKGGLKGSVSSVVLVEAGRPVLRVQATARYAAAVDAGAQPHVIRAKPGGVLAFLDRLGNQRFAKSVNHPGNEPRRFMRRGFEKFGLTVR
jgi:hypothetical protein